MPPSLNPFAARPGWAPAALVAGLGLLVLAWMVGEPPFSSPDEPSHYLRALSIPTDGLIGDENPGYEAPVLSPQQLATVRQEVRTVSVPPGLYPAGLSCQILRPLDSAACQLAAPDPPAEPLRVDAPTGSYPPALYVLPGLAARLGSDPVTAHLLGSAASAALAVALLALAVALAWRAERGVASLVGVLAATTPMVLYVAGSLNPSGPEIAAGMALGAGALRLARSAGERVPGRVWAAVAGAAVVLALSRSVSPAWLALHGLVFLAWAGPRQVGRLVRANPRPAALAGGAVVLAVGAAAAWTLAHGTSVDVALGPWPAALLQSASRGWLAVWRDGVAMLGYLEYGPPGPLYALWRAVWVVLLGAALVFGTARQRVVLLLLVGVALAVPTLLELAVLRQTGFAVQGRHVLPVLVLVPLYAGEVVAERGGRAVTLLAAAVAALTAFVHLSVWFAAAHRAAVGIDGSWRFLGRSEWSPPLGFAAWTVVALSGAALVAAVALARPARASAQAAVPLRPPVPERLR